MLECSAALLDSEVRDSASALHRLEAFSLSSTLAIDAGRSVRPCVRRLGIELIAASSPRAKERVGRSHGTNQDRSRPAFIPELVEKTHAVRSQVARAHRQAPIRFFLQESPDGRRSGASAR